ncbi:MAG: metallophosphoesterase [Bryobacteraceae bacterium]
MKIVIVSDIHGNLEALEALEAIAGPWDELWVLGDLVNYGPNPSEVVDFVRRNAAVAVRGNHDHAIGYGADPRCSAPFREMAREMQYYTESVLNGVQKAFLRELPVAARRTVDGHRFFLCHAVPSEPLFRYLPPGSPDWPIEAERAAADILLVGHTHLPSQAAVGGCQVVNPGSAGQPKHGCPEACYAIWEDGRFLLKSSPYRAEVTAGKVLALPIDERIAGELADVLLRGAPPR